MSEVRKPVILLMPTGTSLVMPEKLAKYQTYRSLRPTLERKFFQWETLRRRPGAAFAEELKGQAEEQIEQIMAELQRIANVRLEIEEGAAGRISRFSAEITSIYLMLERKLLDVEHDTLVLFSSDTVEGMFATIANSRYLDRQLHAHVEPYRVENLQDEDFSLFVKDGIPRLVRYIAWFCREREQTHEIFMNITGGYKSLIPYITYGALFYRLPLYYVFERSLELIDIKPLPFGWNTQEQRQVLILLKKEKLGSGLSVSERASIRPLWTQFFHEKRGLTPIGNFIYEMLTAIEEASLPPVIRF